jgi:hypothetical protein
LFKKILSCQKVAKSYNKLEGFKPVTTKIWSCKSSADQQYALERMDGCMGG